MGTCATERTVPGEGDDPGAGTRLYVERPFVHIRIELPSFLGELP